MPKFLSHWVLAEDTRRRMPPDWRVRRAVDRNPNLYRVGAVAPDTPFYLFLGPGSRRLQAKAEGFHERCGRLEQFLTKAYGQNRGDQCPERRLAFAAGILVHAAADAVFHPMVYYFSGTGTAAARIRHHRLEGYIDLYFSRNLKEPEEKRLGRILRRLEVRVSTLVDWMGDLFSLDGHRQELFCSLRLNVAIQTLFLSPVARFFAHRMTAAAPESVRAYLAHFYPYRLPAPRRLFPDPVVFRNPAAGGLQKRRIAEMGNQAVEAALVALEQTEAGRYDCRSLLPGGWNLHTGIGSFPKAAMARFDLGRSVASIVGLERG